jgi:acyl carrier protein
MVSMNVLVRNILARHLQRDVTTICASDDLERDLDLTPLEIVLVALEVEDVVRFHVELDELAGARTVADLIAFFAMAVVRARGAHEAA